MIPLRLGVIGLSPGNGHPYSWSAIFNGYDREAMETCGFPVIPRYLEQRNWPDDAIAEGEVTHVWTQDPERSAHIAKASHIANVVDDYRDMIGAVDGVLLARDDAASHAEIAAPFLEAGLPIYIDKPLALSTDVARKMFAQQQYPGQLFTCSAMRYARELQLTQEHRDAIGPIRHVHATTPKYWDTYSAHAIEPMLNALSPAGPAVGSHAHREGKATFVDLSWESGTTASVVALGDAAGPIALRFHGERDWCELIFADTFAAFRAALHEFVQGIVHRDVRSDPAFVLSVVGIIETGCQA